MTIHLIPCQRNRIRKNGIGLFLILKILRKRGAISRIELKKATKFLVSTEETLNEPDCLYHSICPVAWVNWLLGLFHDEENDNY
jgi:hypothetical protein